MHRIQFIEIHEQPWFPSFLRDEVTDALQYGLGFLKAYAPISPMLQSALASLSSRSIVDLCSGGGGPWLDLMPLRQIPEPEGIPKCKSGIRESHHILHGIG
jgi:hypothetical protein